MSITGNSKRSGTGYWKGTCSFCGNEITRRNSLVLGNKVSYGQRQDRACRDDLACQSRRQKSVA